MIEIVRLKSKGKTPLFMEVDVPPMCKPLLVGSSKDGLLRWAESPSNRNTILTWGQESSIEEVLTEMVKMTLERGLEENWGVHQVDEKSALGRMSGVGIEDVIVKEGLVFPKDPSVLGSLIIMDNKLFPVLHNVKRGICVIKEP